ncbi:uncharacterized protein KD926_006903 [Aspergillus affinis]|uniref:uncharacterized protein n=1 Tax=Aspergillus affinis TaxID=1070780 RepID=UPI0022FEB412|nr:uncharacterized protein KD926_006903 [Aspergillus affinis]KAI9041327.1 hypothetical protein KD926_006903 [Aspergillus affinis]
MTDTAVWLSGPTSHTVYVDSDGELYGDPLAGTVHISGEISSLQSLQIALVRTVRLCTNASIAAKRSSLKALLSLRKSTPLPETLTTSSSFAQDIIRCNLSTTPGWSTIHPNGTATHDFDFALTSPVHTPETISSGALEVSYELLASATVQNGRMLSNARPMQLICRRFPDPWDIATHSRGFPGSATKAEFTVSPQLAGQGQCTRYSTDIQLRNIAAPGTRRSELTVLVVESLSWHLDEIITWGAKNAESTTTHHQTLARGTKKGRWAVLREPRAPLSEQSIKDMSIAIPLEISIGKDVKATNDLDIDASTSDYNAPSLTVRHQLMVEMVTGTETTSRDNGSLVARRKSVRGFGATIPLPLHSYADTTDVMKMLEGADFGILPGYEKVAIAPPEYREVVGPV